MALKPKVERASILFYVLGAVHCIPGVAAVCIGIHGLQSPPLSEARTWAYLPLVMAAVVLFPWAAIAFVAAYKLQKQAFSGWAIGITYCVVNAVLSCLGIVWIYIRVSVKSCPLMIMLLNALFSLPVLNLWTDLPKL